MPPVVTPQIPTTAPSRVPLATSPRKKANPIMIISVAAIIGCMVIGGVRMAASTKPAETVTIVAAATDIPPGCRLNFSNLHYATLPKKYFSSTMYQSYEEVVGKYTRTFISARDPFTATALISSQAGLTGELPKGFRAITLKLTDEELVDQQVRPGDRVDVVATTPYKTKKYTKTLCQNVLVMLSTPKDAVMSDRFAAQENSRVTLAVDPEQAEVISQAVEESKIRLTLRSLGDLSKAVISGADARDLLPHDALREEAPVLPAMQATIPAPVPPPLPSEPPAFIQDLPPVAQPAAKWVVQMFSGSNKNYAEVDPVH